MTLYWWNHWFWITLICVFATLPVISVTTSPINSPSLEHNDETKTEIDSKLPLEFPLPAHTDDLGANENIPSTLLIKKEIFEKNSHIKDEIPASASITSHLSTEEKPPIIEEKLNDKSVADVDQSIEIPISINDNENFTKIEMSQNKSSIMNSSNFNNNSNNNNSPNNSKSVIQLIPIQNDNINKESHKSESSGNSSIIINKTQSESLDVVISLVNENSNSSKESNISTNISLEENPNIEHLNVLPISGIQSTSTTTPGYPKPVSNIMQVTKSSSKIKSKTSITGGIGIDYKANSKENISLTNSNDSNPNIIDETTTGDDAIFMTTILHPVDENYIQNNGNKIEQNAESASNKSNENNKSEETTGKIPATLDNVTKFNEKSLNKESERFRKSKGLSAEYRDGYINNYSSDPKSVLTRAAGQEGDFAERQRNDESNGNVSSEALQRTYVMDVGTISGICLTVLAICCGVGTMGIVMYRRRFINKPQALSEPDSSVYIDDSTIRDNSDEMYSLDNDSFLNSLEAMTIQNYWTDTVKHTKL